jgi:hypothetical protein
MCLWFCMLLSLETGGPRVGNGARQTTARSPPRLGCAADLHRDPGDRPTKYCSLGGPTRLGRKCCQVFDSLGLSFTSCYLMGRLMRRPSPLAGVVADLRLPLFFTVRTQRTAATSVRGWAGGRAGRRGARANLDRGAPGHSLQ